MFQIKATFEDRPDLQKLFADQVQSVLMVDGVAHITFAAIHITDLQPGAGATGKLRPTAIIAMPLAAADNLRNQLNENFAELEKQGVKRVAQANPAAPKH